MRTKSLLTFCLLRNDERRFVVWEQTDLSVVLTRVASENTDLLVLVKTLVKKRGQGRVSDGLDQGSVEGDTASALLLALDCSIITCMGKPWLRQDLGKDWSGSSRFFDN